jgi:hypothetical protein
MIDFVYNKIGLCALHYCRLQQFLEETYTLVNRLKKLGNFITQFLCPRNCCMSPEGHNQTLMFHSGKVH